MYKYIVTMYPASVGGWVFRPLDGGPRFEAAAARRTPAVEVSGVEMLSTGEEANIPVWYAQTEDIAKQIAQYLAGKKPGCQVCISELKQVAQAAAPRVGMAVFSDRGLVPA